jgi:soluble lytic murein transglycosylase-like protein
MELPDVLTKPSTKTIGHPLIVATSRGGSVTVMVILLMLVSFTFSSPSLAGSVYVYETPNGNRLITDVERFGDEYSLIKEYRTTPYRNAPYEPAPWTARTIQSRYDGLINEVAATHKMEPALVKAVVHVESAFDPFAISRAGAMGLMQLMPETASRYSLSRDQFDPRRNITAGVTHLSELVQQFDGNIRFALAGYNAGSGAVKKYNGIPPYSETQNYVERVMKLYSLYKSEDLD